jgi:hypothetical protein
MKTLRILDSSGDLALIFDDKDPTSPARGGAEALFARLLAGGATAFKVERGGGAPDEKVSDFSALEQHTIVVPRIVGG